MLIKYLKNVRKYDVSDCSFVEEKATNLKKKKKTEKKLLQREKRVFVATLYKNVEIP